MNTKILLAAIMVILLMGIMGCYEYAPQTSSTGIAQKAPTALANSVEQDNINNRLQIMNKASTTLFFYGLSDNGVVIFRSVVKGKVTSSGKRLEPVSTNGNNYALNNNYYCPSTGANGWCSNELLQADGTFGSSDNYVYWFDFEGNYFQWNGYYILTTKALSLPNPTINFQEIKK